MAILQTISRFFFNLYSDLGNNAQKCVFFRIIMSNKLYFNRKPDNLINCVNKANKLNDDGKLLQLTPAYIRVFCGCRRLIYLAVPCLMRDCTCYQELSKQSDIILLFRENDIWVLFPGQEFSYIHRPWQIYRCRPWVGPVYEYNHHWSWYKEMQSEKLKRFIDLNKPTLIRNFPHYKV